MVLFTQLNVCIFLCSYIFLGRKGHRQRSKPQHRLWSVEQKACLMKEFHWATRKQTTVGVGKHQCEEVKKRVSPLLGSRSWEQIKYCVNNIIGKNRKIQIQKNLGQHLFSQKGWHTLFFLY